MYAEATYTLGLVYSVNT